MKRFFLIPLMTMFCVVMAWGNVAKIGNVEYATLAEAVAAAEDGVETQIDLIDDAVVPSVCIIPESKNIILNLNSFGISTSFTGNDQADIKGNCVLYNEGTLRIVSNGKGIIQGSSSSGDAGVVGNKGTLIVDGGIFIGELVLFDQGLACSAPAIWAEGGSITINGGTFLQKKPASQFIVIGDNDWMYFDMLSVINGADATWCINGGVFSGNVSGFMTDANKDTHAVKSVPYKNANIPGYTSNVTVYVVHPKAEAATLAESDATKAVELAANDNVPADATYNAKFVYVDPGKTLTINEGATLHVGNGGVVMGGTDSKIIVAAGGKLISEGDIVTSDDANLHLTMDEVAKKYSHVAFKTDGPLAKHPNATVVLKTKAKCDNGVYTYQRFAVPTYRNDIARKQGVENTAFTYDNVAAPTAIYRWDYTTNDWVVLAPAGDDTFEPFQGYDLTTSAAAAGTEYTFKCELVGRGDAILPLQEGKKWQYFANSYTAPIDIVKLVTDLSTNRSYLNAGVWVHRINGNGWDAIGMGDVDDYVYDQEPMLQYSIQPMQAFVYNLLSTPSTTVLDYNEFVFNPFLQALNNNAPKRGLAATSDYTRATIAIEAADGTNDLVKVYEGSVFDASINNGYDMPKLMNEEGVNMYFNAAEGDLARFASDNVANTAITLETKEATSYTVSFSNVTLAGYALRDNLTGTETELVSGNTYSFSAPVNSKIEGRFEIVAVTKMPTAIENTEVKANRKGIYTLTGQYLGENFHTLPAGVYVINGKKVVK